MRGVSYRSNIWTFLGLANESIRVSERIHGLQAKIDDLARRMPEFKNNLDNMQDLKAIGRERMFYLIDFVLICGV